MTWGSAVGEGLDVDDTVCCVRTGGRRLARAAAPAVDADRHKGASGAGQVRESPGRLAAGPCRDQEKRATRAHLLRNMGDEQGPGNVERMGGTTSLPGRHARARGERP